VLHANADQISREEELRLYNDPMRVRDAIAKRFKSRDPYFDQISRRMPMPVLRAFLRESLRDLDIALYLHRVAEQHRESDQTRGLTIKGSALDIVLDELQRLAPGTRTTCTFDDGYADAAEYLDSRAPRFPKLYFVYNLCPEKTVNRAGFRWDLHEHKRIHQENVGNIDEFLYQAADITTENTRAELKLLADAPLFRLATVEEVKALTRHANVSLGNHSNCHFPLARLNDADAQRELQASRAQFEAHFGPMKHFAFPFGYPGVHFGKREVALLREAGAEYIWCTRESPYARSWQQPGAVLPRIQLLGTWSVKHMLLWIAQRAAVYRVRRARGASMGELPI
jgi:hypothetical protein